MRSDLKARFGGRDSLRILDELKRNDRGVLYEAVKRPGVNGGPLRKWYFIDLLGTCATIALTGERPVAFFQLDIMIVKVEIEEAFVELSMELDESRHHRGIRFETKGLTIREQVFRYVFLKVHGIFDDLTTLGHCTI